MRLNNKVTFTYLILSVIIKFSNVIERLDVEIDIVLIFSNSELYCQFPECNAYVSFGTIFSAISHRGVSL